MSIIKLNNKAVSNATAFGSISSLGSMVFIKKLTASSSATLSFVDGTDGVVLDDTYKEYVFTFKDIHPATNRAIFGFNLSTDSGSNYNVTKTTTAFIAFHSETNDADVALSYDTGFDLAQSTADQRLTQYISSDGDSSASGNMSLFNPASTTYVKHFISSCNNMVITSDLTEYFTMNQYVAGYGNTTSAVDAIRFQFSSGNIDAGDICLYGIA
jgi:hypothetical protein